MLFSASASPTFPSKISPSRPPSTALRRPPAARAPGRRSVSARPLRINSRAKSLSVRHALEFRRAYEYFSAPGEGERSARGVVGTPPHRQANAIGFSYNVSVTCRGLLCSNVCVFIAKIRGMRNATPCLSFTSAFSCKLDMGGWHLPSPRQRTGCWQQDTTRLWAFRSHIESSINRVRLIGARQGRRERNPLILLSSSPPLVPLYPCSGLRF